MYEGKLETANEIKQGLHGPETAARTLMRAISEHLLHAMVGGADRDRTDDPLLAKQVLSQLSYSPTWVSLRPKWWAWVDSNYRPHPYQGCALTN